VLEARLGASEERITDLEQSVVEAKLAATESEQQLIEVRRHLLAILIGLRLSTDR